MLFLPLFSRGTRVQDILREAEHPMRLRRRIQDSWLVRPRAGCYKRRECLVSDAEPASAKEWCCIGLGAHRYEGYGTSRLHDSSVCSRVTYVSLSDRVPREVLFLGSEIPFVQLLPMFFVSENPDKLIRQYPRIAPRRQPYACRVNCRVASGSAVAHDRQSADDPCYSRSAPSGYQPSDAK